MKYLLILALVFCLSQGAKGQSTGDIMLGGGLDLIKTDNPGVFEKAQAGLEINYFVVRHFAVGLGTEVWSDQRSSFTMGARWYANEHVFARFRGLIGANDVSLGGGFSKALSEYLRLEAIGDFYLESTEFGARIGLSYVIR